MPFASVHEMFKVTLRVLYFVAGNAVGLENCGFKLSTSKIIPKVWIFPALSVAV
ncbi:hypothetical protein HYU10_04410 [Candidatus Woesearchaeota archaeon]|nr:hypothetical protein [Candidatus Woesearchaeota archaeon]